MDHRSFLGNTALVCRRMITDSGWLDSREIVWLLFVDVTRPLIDDARRGVAEWS